MSVVYDPKVRTTYTDDVVKLRESHMLLLEVPFTPSLPDKGYTRRTLFIDLDTLTVKEKPITEEMIDIFTGGRVSASTTCGTPSRLRRSGTTRRTRSSSARAPSVATRSTPVPASRLSSRSRP